MPMEKIWSKDGEGQSLSSGVLPLYDGRWVSSPQAGNLAIFISFYLN